MQACLPRYIYDLSVTLSNKTCSVRMLKANKSVNILKNDLVPIKLWLIGVLGTWLLQNVTIFFTVVALFTARRMADGSSVCFRWSVGCLSWWRCCRREIQYAQSQSFTQFARESIQAFHILLYVVLRKFASSMKENWGAKYFHMLIAPFFKNISYTMGLTLIFIFCNRLLIWIPFSWLKLKTALKKTLKMVRWTYSLYVYT